WCAGAGTGQAHPCRCVDQLPVPFRAGDRQPRYRGADAAPHPPRRRPLRRRRRVAPPRCRACRPGDAAPARFAVHNIVVRAGAVDFADTPVHATHLIRDLELGVPFLSTLPSEREVKVEPHLAFALDGSRFDSAAAATPWYKRGEGEAKLHLDRFDIAPYFVYLPQGLPARPQSALVSADLLLAFERRPRLALRISGTVEVDAIKVVDAASQELLQAGSVKVAI